MNEFLHLALIRYTAYFHYRQAACRESKQNILYLAQVMFRAHFQDTKALIRKYINLFFCRES